MSKDLEAFGLIKRTCEIYMETTRFLKGSDIVANQIKEALSTIQKRLESIDNANPSEALKQYETIYDLALAYCEEHNPEIIRSALETRNENIKQALLKAQEPKQYVDELKLVEKKLKALEIIKEKSLTNCNIALVKDNLHYQNYCKEFEYFLNKYKESPNGFEITKEDLLTEEEFNLLKEVLGC